MTDPIPVSDVSPQYAASQIQSVTDVVVSPPAEGTFVPEDDVELAVGDTTPANVDERLKGVVIFRWHDSCF